MSKDDRPYDDPFSGSVEKRALYEYHLAQDCILPLLARWGVDVQDARALDVGCGSGGLVVALAERGAQCWGIDLQPERIAHASKMAADHGVAVQLLAGDVLEIGNFGGAFDLVVLSEVVEHLEHLANVETLLGWCRERLSADGRAYVSFPPWFSPFAGHQAGWDRIRYVPWFHLLPGPVQRLVAGARGPAYIEFTQELNQLTIGTFERIIGKAGLAIAHKELYLIRPEFYRRYGVPALRSGLLARIPVLREVTTMGAYYLLGGCGKRPGDDAFQADVRQGSRSVGSDR